MRFWFIFFLGLHASQSSQAATKRSSLIDSELISNPCKPTDDADIADSDPLVNHMFAAYKKQAEGETPPGKHSTTLADVNAHELLARVLIFIDEYYKGKFPKSDQTALSLFDVRSDEQRWVNAKKWPYKCFDAPVVQALDHFLGKLSAWMEGKSNSDLRLYEYSIVLRLPQFAPYVQNMNKTPLHKLCPMLLTAENEKFKSTIKDLLWFMRVLMPIAEVACNQPYESPFFCKFRATRKDLDDMLDDYKRAGDSKEMQKFALFWFFSPGIGSICEESFQGELSTKVLKPYARLAATRLHAITKLRSTTGDDLRTIRTFIYDYIFNYFKYYPLDLPLSSRPTPLTPFTREEAPDSKYNSNYFPNARPYSVPEKDLLQCFRYFFANLLNMEKALTEDAGIAEVKEFARVALLWFLHPDFHLDTSEYHESVLDGIDYFIKNKDSLLRLGKTVKYNKNTICTARSVSRPAKYCYIYEVLHDIKVFTITFYEEPMKKILNPSSNYKKILELSTMRSIQSDIAALEVNQEQLEQSIFNIRSSLGNHFHQLATFDQDKAEYDVGFLQDKIEDFTYRIRDTKIKDKLYILLWHAIGSNVAEMGQLAAQLAGSIAKNCNPVAWVTGSADLLDVADRANALAKAGVDTTKLIALHEKVFPRIEQKGRDISKALEANAVIHRKLNTTFHKIKDKESIDIDVVQESFLLDYRGYDPGWSTGDIAEYTILLKEVIEELCNILYSGGTAASAVVQIVGASQNACLNTKVDAEILEAVYLEMYDFQYEFMEAMAQAVRALITKHSANNVKNIPQQADDAQTYRISLKSYAYRIKLQSKHHVLLALRAVCDVDEYKNGGVPTDECKDALQSLAFGDVDRVIGRQISECPADQTSTFNVRFPAVLNERGTVLQPGILDLTKLYAGELTPFQIPYAQILPWTGRFISSFVPTEPEVGLYVKRMEIYLPNLYKNMQEIRVTIKQDGLMSVAPGGDVMYGFSKPKKFSLLYAENKATCASVDGFVDSPYPKLCDPGPSKICVSSKGVVSENEISPPLYSKWLIQVTMADELPKPKPQSDGSFYLRGVMSVCHKNPKDVELRQANLAPAYGDIPEDKCCEDGQFWFIDDLLPNIQLCVDCQTGYSTELGGLFCGKDEKEASGHHHHKHLKHSLRLQHERHFNQDQPHKRKKNLIHYDSPLGGKMKKFFSFESKKRSIMEAEDAVTKPQD